MMNHDAEQHAEASYTTSGDVTLLRDDDLTAPTNQMLDSTRFYTGCLAAWYEANDYPAYEELMGL
jgi:hypothetical protein